MSLVGALLLSRRFPHKPRTRRAGHAVTGRRRQRRTTDSTAPHRTAPPRSLSKTHNRTIYWRNTGQNWSAIWGDWFQGVGKLSARAVSAQSPECPGERGAQSTAASRRLPHRLVPHSRWCRKYDSDALHPGLLSHSGELWVCLSFSSKAWTPQIYLCTFFFNL